MFKTFQEVLTVSDQIEQTLESIRKGNSPRGEVYLPIGVQEPDGDSGYKGENVILVRHWLEGGMHSHVLDKTFNPLRTRNSEYLLHISIVFISREMVLPLGAMPVSGMINNQPDRINAFNPITSYNNGGTIPHGIVLFTDSFQVRRHVPTLRIIHEFKRKLISCALERITHRQMIQRVRAVWFKEVQTETSIFISAVNDAGEVIAKFEHERTNPFSHFEREEITTVFAINAFIVGLIANKSDHQTGITELLINE